MAFWKNPFDAPPPIARSPLPGEDSGKAAKEAEFTKEIDIDALPDERATALQTSRELTVEFTGDSKEYFRLWATCQALTFLTLGFYAPWAKVRKTRYLARHTLLDGVPFEYRANPAAILRGRLLAYGLFAVGAALSLWQPAWIPFLIALAFVPLPWLLTYSFGFKWRTLCYRNIQFGFESDVKPIRWSVWLIGIATAALFAIQLPTYQKSANISVFVLFAFVFFVSIVAWPYVTSCLLHHRFTNARWGEARFHLGASVKEIMKVMWKGGKAFMISIAFIYGFFSGASMLIKNPDVRALLQAVAYVVMAVCAVAFGRTRRLNFILNRLTIDNRLRTVSTLDPDAAARRAAGYALAGIASLGLLLPWATIHFAKWRARNLRVTLDGSWGDFPDAKPTVVRGATVEALAEQFEIEIGF